MFEYIWILLPIGLLIGWLAAKRDNAKKQKIMHYLNLRYFLEETKSLDNISLDIPLESDAEDNLNFSLLLGDTFRKRGEIGRAIDLHEYLLNEAPTEALAYKVHYSLAADYLAAGFLDRAEEKLRYLLASEEYREEALLQLSHLYKQQREWMQSIAALEKLSEPSQEIYEEISHLYCELAERELQKTTPDFERLLLWLEKAELAEPNTARISLIKAFTLVELFRYEEALSSLLAIEHQQPKLLPIALPILYDLSFLLGREEPFSDWLDAQIAKPESHISFKFWRAHLLVYRRSMAEGIAYLESALEGESNLRGLMLLNRLLRYGKDSENLALFDKTFRELLDQYARFQCDSCGFTSKVLQWSCPSCREWNSYAPVTDVISLKHH